MASFLSLKTDELVKEKLEERVKDISEDTKGRETREANKSSEEIAAVLVPELAKVISLRICGRDLFIQGNYRRFKGKKF